MSAMHGIHTPCGPTPCKSDIGGPPSRGLHPDPSPLPTKHTREPPTHLHVRQLEAGVPGIVQAQHAGPHFVRRLDGSRGGNRGGVGALPPVVVHNLWRQTAHASQAVVCSPLPQWGCCMLPYGGHGIPLPHGTPPGVAQPAPSATHQHAHAHLLSSHKGGALGLSDQDLREERVRE